MQESETNNKPPSQPKLKQIAYFIATGFGAGRAPIAPGTFGTLVGVLFYFLLRDLTPTVYTAVVLAMFLLGVGLCGAVERQIGAHDHSSIVWDEVVGYLIAMFLAPPGWLWIVVGFLLFRLFDIWKPFPIRTIERIVQGGLGTMLDDVLAAIYAFFALQSIVYILSAL